VLLASWVAAYFLFRNLSSSEATNSTAASSAVTQASPATSPEAPAGASAREGTKKQREETSPANGSILSELFGARTLPGNETRPEGWLELIGLVTLRLLLAALLASALAFRPRRQFTALRRNPSVAQTQILLAVVASALMMTVGDSAARAFGIFAAASLVRFRTNIRDPKEITVLLISLAVGLATGVGRWELAVMLSLFALILLWILEYREPGQIFRAMELTVTSRNIEATQEIIRSLLEKHGFSSELRTLSRTNEDGAGSLVYHIDMSPLVSTDKFSEEIFAGGAGDIAGVAWEQKKSFSYVYQ
jgi:hypothetical protein